MTSFTNASRRNLNRFMLSVDEGGLPSVRLFLTLTYPGEWVADGRAWEAHRRAFVKRLRRLAPGVVGVWKLEPQKRGAPHFHLVICSPAEVPAAWVSQAWYEVVGSGDRRHLLAGTNVQLVRSWVGVAFYTAKYLAKAQENHDLPEGWGKAGRWWGKFGPWPVRPVVLDLDEITAHRVRRSLARFGRFTRKDGTRYQPTIQRGKGITSQMSDVGLLKLVHFHANR